MMKMSNGTLEYYSQHSIFSNPGKYARLFDDLPADISSLVQVVQGLLINPNEEEIHNIRFSSMQKSEAHMRTVAEMLSCIQKYDASPLTVSREPAQRQSASIRHFTILLISMLRHRGVPARMRVGFVTYLDKKKNEDRWIVEYWDSKQDKWKLLDPGISSLHREYYKIEQDSLNLQHGQDFMLAGQAWQLCLDKKANHLDFGYKNMGGKRYIRGNLLRDVESLNLIELLPWDFFGDIYGKNENELSSEERDWIDQLADLTTQADANLDQIQDIYTSMPHSRLITSKLRLLGLLGDCMRADTDNLRTNDSERLKSFQVAEFQPANPDLLTRRTEVFRGLNSFDLSDGNQPTDFNNIVVRGARQHNLKNINVSIPRSQLVVVTGVSGSGKSSLAFDTIYAEGQRRFMGSFSGASHQFANQFEKPEVDQIIGLNPAIAIEQRNTSSNPRSTVGTLTDIYDYLRVLFVRAGTFHCPQCGKAVQPLNYQQIVNKLLGLKPGTDCQILARLVKDQKGTHVKQLRELKKNGYTAFRIDMTLYDLSGKIPALDKAEIHTIDLIIAQLKIADGYESRQHLNEAVKTALKFGNGSLIIAIPGEADIVLSEKNMCPDCDITFSELKPSFFSYNHPEGMCPECDGLGEKLSIDPDLIVDNPQLSLLDGACQIYGTMRKVKNGGNWVTGQVFALAEEMNVDLEKPWNELAEEFRQAVLYGTGDKHVKFSYEVGKSGRTSEIDRPMEGLVNMVNRLYRQSKSKKSLENYVQMMSKQLCPVCHGERLCAEARYVTIGGARFPEVATMTIAQANDWIMSLPFKLGDQELTIASEILQEIKVRLQFLVNVGLHYLTLDRPAPTLSGGEAQRIRLATQLGCGLMGLLYVLDEPSIGLHPRDHKALLNAMINLKNAGNTVLVVEHDDQTMRAADYIIELGPGAGVFGGTLIAQGTPEEIMENPQSLTGKYLKGDLQVTSPKGNQRRNPQGWLTLVGARLHNLQNVTVQFPLGTLTCITGVSGSGKSSLVVKTLAPALSRKLHNSLDIPGIHDRLEGIEQIDKIIWIDQTPIGRSPRSNPATYVDVFDEIRKAFANTPEAKAKGFKTDQFSFNNKTGRCESCEGLGVKKVELHFLPDVWVKCQECNGERYNPETLEVKYHGKSISDVLDMDVLEAIELFIEEPKIIKILNTLSDVGLDYIKLGQSAVTLSGGEAQRIKLAKELCRPDTGKTLYIIDEPTTGLHFADIQKLLNVLHRLTDQGNTVMIIEHNLDVIKTADWLIDLGPEGGENGGKIVAQGTPEVVARSEVSYTGQFLKQLL